MRSLVLASLLLATECGCGFPGRSPEVKRVEVWLDKPVASICGVAWPEDKKQYFCVEGGHQVRVHFPSGVTLDTFSRISFFSEKDGIVKRVSVTPLERPVSFQEALDHVIAVGKKLEVDEENPFWGRCTQARGNPPNKSPCDSIPLGCKLASGFQLFATIRRVNETDEYFVTYDFTMLK